MQTERTKNHIVRNFCDFRIVAREFDALNIPNATETAGTIIDPIPEANTNHLDITLGSEKINEFNYLCKFDRTSNKQMSFFISRKV